jgi:hypothetical protein
MKKVKDLGKPKAIKITLEELEYISKLKDSPEWDVFKKIAEKYVQFIQESSFWIPYTDTNFREKHADAIGQAYGIRKVLEIVDESGREKVKRSGVGS